MSYMNADYRSPNYNALRRSMQGALGTLTFSDGVSIDVIRWSVVGPRPALRVTFQGDIYKPNYNPRLGPIKGTPYYDIILETRVIEQQSDTAARPEDIQKIVTALKLTLQAKEPPPVPAAASRAAAPSAASTAAPSAAAPLPFAHSGRLHPSMMKYLPSAQKPRIGFNDPFLVPIGTSQFGRGGSYGFLVGGRFMNDNPLIYLAGMPGDDREDAHFNWFLEGPLDPHFIDLSLKIRVDMRQVTGLVQLLKEPRMEEPLWRAINAEVARRRAAGVQQNPFADPAPEQAAPASAAAASAAAASAVAAPRAAPGGRVVPGPHGPEWQNNSSAPFNNGPRGRGYGGTRRRKSKRSSKTRKYR